MNKKLLASAGALVALALSAGGAFTASNTMDAGTQTAGFGNVTVSGATVEAIDYTQNADGTQIDAATVVFTGDQTGKTVKVGFDTVADKSCTLGTYNSTDDSTTASCAALAQDITAALSFNVSVVS